MTGKRVFMTENCSLSKFFVRFFLEKISESLESSNVFFFQKPKIVNKFEYGNTFGHELLTAYIARMQQIENSSTL